VPALPLTASGKVDRGSLPSVGGSKAASAGVRIPPRDPLETDLARQWEAALGVRDIGVFDHFFDLGGHSLLAARMVDDYERETGIRIPLTALFVDDTIAGVARAIRRGSLSANAAVVPLNEDGSRPPFVYVHGDFFGGGFHSHALARRLGSDQPVYVVHPHGLAGGVVPATIEAMAEERLHALRALLPHGPYVIGGHCNGAFVAFELARRLREDGEAVPAVIVVDAAAPSEASAAASADPRATAALAAAAGIPPPTDRVSDLANSLFRAMRGYRGGRADVHLVVVRSEESDAATHDGAWSALASSVERHVLPGDHTTLVLSGEGERFAAVIRDVIDRAIARERA
jgi:thioesterase domain-containing protein/acyl carrier protein